MTRPEIAGLAIRAPVRRLGQVFPPDLFSPLRIAVRRCADARRDGFIDLFFADTVGSLKTPLEAVKLQQRDFADASGMQIAG